MISTPPPRAALPADTPREEVIDLGAIAATLWRGKAVIAATALAAVLAAGTYAYGLATPLFRATTSLVLDTRQEEVVDLDSVMGGLSADSEAINTEVEILRGRRLMGQVVDRLDLVSDPEFNGTLREAGQLSLLVGAARDNLKAFLGAGEEPPSEPTPEMIRERVISALLEKVAVANIPLSLVFTVTAETESARKSALIADTLAQLYILDQIAVKYEATEQATAWLADRVTGLQADLETAEGALKDFQSAADAIDAQTLAASQQQLTGLRLRLSEQESIAEAAQARLDALRAAETDEERAEVARDALLSRLVAADGTSAEAFGNRFAALLAEAEQELSRAELQLGSLRRSAAELAATIDRQSGELIRFEQLTREAEAVRLIYEYFLGRLQETSAQQGLAQADSRVLSAAVVPEQAASPQKSRLLAIASVLGTLLGTAGVFLWDLRARGARTARELEEATGYPAMGQMPLIRKRGAPAILSYLSERPTSAAAEAVRNLRTSILLSRIDQPPRAIMVTSSVPGEGKTTLSLALAQNLGTMGRKVLLIDGDLRRRAASNAMSNPARAGLLSVLTGLHTLDEAVSRDEVLRADVLAGEVPKAVAADVFASEAFTRLMATLRDRYDTIVIDTPPVLVVPDARLIAQHVDVILFAVKWNATGTGQVREGLRLFESVNRKVGGLVLTQINMRKLRGYGAAGAYAAYGNQGHAYYVD